MKKAVIFLIIAVLAGTIIYFVKVNTYRNQSLW